MNPSGARKQNRRHDSNLHVNFIILVVSKSCVPFAGLLVTLRIQFPLKFHASVRVVLGELIVVVLSLLHAPFSATSFSATTFKLVLSKGETCSFFFSTFLKSMCKVHST